MTRIHFPVRSGFHATVKERVDRYFEENGVSRTGDWRMFLKTGLALACAAVSYVYLVFYARSLWEAALAGFWLCQGFVLMGFNIIHDGGHGSYSGRPWVNRMAGAVMDLMGGSQWVWHHRHNVLHHTYTNIHGVDNDLHSSGMLRLSPDQPWRPFYRWQHLYAPLVYGMVTATWLTYKDFRTFLKGRVEDYRLSRMTADEQLQFFLGKGVAFGYWLILPMCLHPVWQVLAVFLYIQLILGMNFATVFQLAHISADNTFPRPDAETGAVQKGWAIHEVETTSNFATRNRLANWYLGGLNFQIEHHLFPHVCHVHYPAICRIVEETCREFSIPYVTHPTVRGAVAAHFRFLKALGAPEK
jgi:linoleoyl-CoA desaturase